MGTKSLRRHCAMGCHPLNESDEKEKIMTATSKVRKLRRGILSLLAPQVITCQSLPPPERKLSMGLPAFPTASYDECKIAIR